eukprot:m.150122 g.150122  ORF g.150122 m.150122 type:complete len:56 (+) comp14262_c0_seq4:4236-4403(+)
MMSALIWRPARPSRIRQSSTIKGFMTSCANFEDCLLALTDCDIFPARLGYHGALS